MKEYTQNKENILCLFHALGEKWELLIVTLEGEISFFLDMFCVVSWDFPTEEQRGLNR